MLKKSYSRIKRINFLVVPAICVLLFQGRLEASQNETMNLNGQYAEISQLMNAFVPNGNLESRYSVQAIFGRSQQLSQILNQNRADQRELFRRLYYQQKEALQVIIKIIQSTKISPSARLLAMDLLSAEAAQSHGALRTYVIGQLKPMMLTMNFAEKEIAKKILNYAMIYRDQNGLLNNQSFSSRVLLEHQIEAAEWDLEDIIEKSSFHDLRKIAVRALRDQAQVSGDLKIINQHLNWIETGKPMTTFTAVWRKLMLVFNQSEYSHQENKNFTPQLVQQDLKQLLNHFKNETVIRQLATSKSDRYAIFDFLFELRQIPVFKDTELAHLAQLTFFEVLQKALRLSHRSHVVQNDLIKDVLSYQDQNLKLSLEMQEEIVTELLSKALQGQFRANANAATQRELSTLLIRVMQWQVEIIQQGLIKLNQPRTVKFALQSLQKNLNFIGQFRYQAKADFDFFKIHLQGLLSEFGNLLETNDHYRDAYLQLRKDLLNIQKATQSDDVTIEQALPEVKSRKSVSKPLFERLRPAVNNKNNCRRVFIFSKRES